VSISFIRSGDAGTDGAAANKGYVGSRGDKGDSGPAGGYTGSVGYVGSKGDTGSQGDIGPAGAGYTGSVGYVGSQGDTGSTGPAGAGYTGSVGYVGSMGPQGPAGGYTGSSGYVGSQGTSGVARYTFSATTSTNLGNLATANINYTNGYKSYVLFKIVTSCEAWVRIYSDSASRTADASRSIGTDPLPGSGIIAEVLTTTGYLTQLITPGIFGFNNDNPVTTTLYLAVTNYNASTQAAGITVTLTMVQMEL
jgi:hypothetical protein